MAVIVTKTQQKTDTFGAGCSGSTYFKLEKLFVIFVALVATEGCAGGQPAESQADLLHDLQAENEQLQAKITQLQEQELKATRAAAESCADKKKGKKSAQTEGKGGDSAKASNAVVADLPVVRLSPESSDAPRAAPEAYQSSSLSRSEEQEGGGPPGTRTVIEVSGDDEGKVYNRPLDSDGKGKASGAKSP